MNNKLFIALSLIIAGQATAMQEEVLANGDRVVSEADGSVRIFNRDGNLLGVMKPDRRPTVRSVCVRADGTIETFSEDGTVCIWNQNGTLLSKK